MSKYVIWYNPNGSIVEPETISRYLYLTDSNVRGIKKGYRLLTVADPLAMTKFQIQRVLIGTTPTIDVSRLEETDRDVPGLFTTTEYVNPISSMLPAEYRKYPYTYYLLVSLTKDYKVIYPLQDLDELIGFNIISEILGFDPENIVIALEDVYGNSLQG
jgi:hypothetical protein